MKPLTNTIALVAGATRGAGRGIACALGEAGATVYCTGRSTRGQLAGPRPETIDETAELVTSRGGRGIAVRVDHTDEAQVEALCARIRADHGGLDVLVNDIWGGESLMEMDKPFWALTLSKARQMLDQAIFTHVVTSRHAAPLMFGRERALIVEVTDGDSFGYRGNLIYDLVKMAVIRLAFAQHWELRPHGVTALAITPGFLRSEEMLHHFGVTEATWRDGVARDPHFIASETPLFVGRAVAALAADPAVGRRSGRVFSSWGLSREYGFTDADGTRPDWGRYFEKAFGRAYRVADEAGYAWWEGGPMDIVSEAGSGEKG
ncbi:3-oxoacyl-[acyl-carrier protein] reductase [Minicystis rosea]|nr:3-oxoacyl-[acyl-carrier protein] reductase [Minicystis rosea]